MRRTLLCELHYITAISNVASIMQRGILCHNLSPVRKPVLISNAEVQQRRAQKKTPSGQPLHDYANLYFSARNPMMYVRRGEHVSICVLRVRPQVIETADEVFVTDGNAASDATRFWQGAEGIDNLDVTKVFAEYWTDKDENAEREKKRARCAEVLIYKIVPPRFIAGAYASCVKSRTALIALAPTLSVTINAHLFFQNGV